MDIPRLTENDYPQPQTVPQTNYDAINQFRKEANLPGTVTPPTELSDQQKVLNNPRLDSLYNTILDNQGYLPGITAADVSPDESRLNKINQILAQSNDPVTEVQRLLTAEHMSRILEMPPDYVYKQLPQIMEAWNGGEYNEKNAWDSIKQQWNTGMQMYDLAKLYTQQLYGDESPELQARIDALESAMPSGEEAIKGWPLKMIQATAGFLPMMLRSPAEATTGAVASAGAGAILGATTGFAPAALPGAVLGFSIGMTAGTTHNVFELEAGLVYRDMLNTWYKDEDSGEKIYIDPKIAKAVSYGVGIINAVIEAGQTVMLPGVGEVGAELIKSGTRKVASEGLDLLFKKSAKKTIRRMMTEGHFVKAAVEAMKRFGSFIIPETLEEVKQAAVSGIGVELAKDLTNDARGTEFEEDWQPVLDDMVQSGIEAALGFPVLGLGPAIISSVDSINTGRANARANITSEKVGDTVLAPASTQDTSTTGHQPEGTAKNTPDTPVSPPTTAEAQLEAVSEEEQNAKTPEQIEAERVAKLAKQNEKKAAAQKYMIRDPQIGTNADDTSILKVRVDDGYSGKKSGDVSFKITDNGKGLEITEMTAWSPNEGREIIEQLKSNYNSRWVAFTDSAIRDTFLPREMQTPTRQVYEQVNEKLKGRDADVVYTEIPVQDRETFKKNVTRHFPNYTPDQIDAALDIVDRRAAAMNMSPDEWVKTFIAEDAFVSNALFDADTRKAATTFLQEGKAAMFISQNADFSTFVHEFAHVIEAQLSLEERQALREYVGAKSARRWSVAAKEKFAEDFVLYLRDGQAPTPQMESIFQRIKNWLSEIAHLGIETFDAPDDVRQVYANLLKDPEPAIIEDVEQIASQKIEADPFMGEDAIFQFVGEGANLSPGDLNNLEIAKQMDSREADNEAIRQATGWFRNPFDGKWRKETSFDTYEQINQEAAKGGLFIELKEFLEDSELLKNYPDLGEVILKVDTKAERSHGTYKPGTPGDDQFFGRSPEIHVDLTPEDYTAGRLPAILAHEIQHAIQDIEGFAKGSSPAAFATESLSVWETPEYQQLDAAVGQLFDNLSGDAQSMMREWNKLAWVDRKHGEEFKARHGQAAYDKRNQARDRLWAEINQKYHDEAQAYWEASRKRAEYADEYTHVSAIEKYRKTAGEIEARDVQYRMGMREGRRKEVPPAVIGQHPEDAIILFQIEKKGEPRQPTTDIDEIYRLTEEARDEFAAYVDEIAKEYGGRLVDGRTIVVSKVHQIATIAEDLYSRPEVIRLKNRYKNPVFGGYRDLLLNVAMSNGAVVELQVTHEAMIAAKEGPGQKLYEVMRNLDFSDQNSKTLFVDMKQAMEMVYGFTMGNFVLQDRVYDPASVSASSFEILEDLQTISAGWTKEGFKVPSEETVNTFKSLLSIASADPSLSKYSNIADASVESLMDAGDNVKETDILWQNIEDSPILFTDEELEEIGISYGSKDAYRKALEEVLSTYRSVSTRQARRKNVTLRGRTLAEGKSSVPVERIRRIDIVGKQVRNTNDLASLLTIFRNPRTEMFHQIFVSESGEILAHRAISSGLPDRSYAMMHLDADQSFEELNQYIDSLGAAKVYLAHNHPSGDVSSSREDIAVSGAYWKRLGEKLGGHIILDHDKYRFISDIGEESVNPLNPNGKDYNVPRENFQPDTAGRQFQKIFEQDGDIDVMVVLNNKLNIVSWNYVDHELPVSHDHTNLIKIAGGTYAVYLTNNEDHFNAVKESRMINAFSIHDALLDVQLLDREGDIIDAANNDGYMPSWTTVTSQRFKNYNTRPKFIVDNISDQAVLFQNIWIEQDDVKADLDALEQEYQDRFDDYEDRIQADPEKNRLLRYGQNTVARTLSNIRHLLDGQTFFESGHPRSSAAIVHPSSREEYNYQISYFDNRGPYSHTSLNTMAEVIHELQMSHHEPAEYTGVLFQKTIEPASKNLLAMHNVSEEKLAKAAEVGGLPMPSVAITKKNVPFDHYGEISLIAPRDLIDPQVDRRTKVFDADVYSPRVPTATYQIDRDGLMALIREMAPVIEESYKNSEDSYYHDMFRGESMMFASIEESLKEGNISWIGSNRELETYYRAAILGESADPRTVDGTSPGFNNWKEDTFKPFLLNPRLFKGFTNAGTRRYVAYTLENIVKEMRSQGVQNGENYNYGLPSIRAQVAKRFRNLGQIQKAADRIVTHEEFTAARAELEEFFNEILEEGVESYTYEQHFDTSDIFVGNLIEGIKRRDIRGELEQFGFEISDELIGKIGTLIDTVKNLPAHYFEAKLDRAVFLDEFAGAVVPANASRKTRKLLEDNGMPVFEYTPGDLASRADAIQQVVDSVQDTDILFQDTEYTDQLIDAAKSFDDWKEFMNFVEAMFDEPDQAVGLEVEAREAWYQDFWTRHNQDKLNQDQEDQATMEEANKKFLEEMDSKEAVERFLKYSWDTGVMRDNRAGRGAHQLILANQHRVITGKPITDASFKIIRGYMRNDPTFYRYIWANVQEDPETIQAIEKELGPKKTEDLFKQRLTIAQRIEDPKERIKLWTGEKNAGAIIREYEKLEKDLEKAKREAKDWESRWETGVAAQKRLEGQLRTERFKVGDALKGARSESRKIVARTKKEAFKKGQEHQKEIQKRRDEKKRIRDYTFELADRIMKNASDKTIEYSYRKDIEALQAEFDPAYRSAQTLKIREYIRAMQGLIMKRTEKPVRVSQATWDLAQKRSINEFTVAELEKLAAEIESLFTAGKDAMDAKIAEIRRHRNNMQWTMISHMIGNTPIERIPHITSETMKETMDKGSGIRKIDAAATRPYWMLQKLDGKATRKAQAEENKLAKRQNRKPRQIKGAFEEYVWEAVNAATDEGLRMRDQRVDAFKAMMKELGIKPKEWFEKKSYEYKNVIMINGRQKVKFDKIEYQIQDAMYMYGGMKNQRNREALYWGDQIANIQEIVNDLPDKFKKMVDWIQAEFADNHPRLNEAFIEDQNKDMGFVDAYLPMSRMDLSGEPDHRSLARELTEALGYSQSYTDKGFTKSRIDIGKLHQKPVRTDLFNLTLEAYQKQEHYIASWKTIKDLQQVIKRDAFKRAMIQAYGKEYHDWLQKYINDFANPRAMKEITDLNTFANKALSNYAVSVLALNMGTVLKQIPSVAYYIPYIDKVHWVTAATKLLNPQDGFKWWNFVNENDPQMRNRTLDQTVEHMRTLASKDSNLKALIAKVGMKPIAMMDKAVTTFGWLAVYDTEMAKHGDHERAARAAQTATITTQPAGLAKDLAQMYRQSNPFIRSFLMFSNQPNQIWNQMVYGVPYAVQEGRTWHAVSKIIALALGFVGIGLIGEVGKEDDESWINAILRWLSLGAVNSIPAVGKDITSGIIGWDASPAIWGDITNTAATAVPEIVEGDYETAAKKALEAITKAKGIPYTGPKKIIRSITEPDPWELIGRHE